MTLKAKEVRSYPGRFASRMLAVIALVLTVGLAPVLAKADDSDLTWHRLSAKDLQLLKLYAHATIGGDAAQPATPMLLWKIRHLPLTQTAVATDWGDKDPSGVGPALVWIQGQLSAEPDGQERGGAIMSFDYALENAPTMPVVDIATPSFNLFVFADRLPDIEQLVIVHDAGTQRDIVRQSASCQMARWSRQGEIVKVVGLVQNSEDRAVQALCTSRIVLFGLGLNFPPAGLPLPTIQGAMVDITHREFILPDYRSDMPLLELLYRTDLQPGDSRAKIVGMIDDLKARE